MAISSDTLICRQIEAALDEDYRTKDATIDVACVAGMVSLTGDVKGAATKVAAERVARTVSGVHGVDNELRVR